MADQMSQRDEKERAKLLLRRACHCFDAGQFVEVLQLCREILDTLPLAVAEPEILADLFFLQGSVAVDDGNLYTALEQFRQAIHLNPTRDIYHYNLGHAFTMLGEAQNAISAFQEAIRLNPNQADAFNGIGVILSRLNRNDEALRYFAQALAIDPHLKTVEYNVAVATRRGVVHIAPTCIISPFACIAPMGGEIRLRTGTTVGDYSQLKAMGGTIAIGENCSIQDFCQLYGHGGLTIGNDVRIAAQTIIIPSNHNFDRLDLPIRAQGDTCLGITIGDDVWIGAGCKILDGVTIGSGCVIGAGSVVNRSLPPYSVAVGVPARVIRTRGEKICAEDRVVAAEQGDGGWPPLASCSREEHFNQEAGA
ncbi:MAG: tetratricopeptide repeat protein [Thermodesulfobacteriota bacterium]